MSDIQFVTNIVGGIISRPEDLKIVRTVDEMGVLLSMTVHKEDMGKVIGMLKGQLAGKADMGKVSGLVKAALAK